MGGILPPIQLTQGSLRQTLNIDQKNKILASDGADDHGFGSSMDSSSFEAYVFKTYAVPTENSKSSSVALNGNIAVIGAYNLKKVYIYERVVDDWIEKQVLNSPDVNNDWFGYSVSIEGDIIVVGARAYNSNQGAAYVYRYTNNDPQNPWEFEQQLLASDGLVGDLFGYSVVNYGDIIAVGSPSKDPSPYYNNGGVYIYKYNGTTWEEKQIIYYDNTATYKFGARLSLQGYTLVIGNDSPSGSKVAVFRSGDSGDTWNEEQILRPSDLSIQTDPFYGIGVTIKDNLILVGSINARDGDSNAPITGAVYAYEYDNVDPQNPWVEKYKINGTVQYDGFGSDVGVSGDILVIGREYADTWGSNVGAANIYNYDGSDPQNPWVLVKSIEPNLPNDRLFGYSVAIDGDNIAICGSTNYPFLYIDKGIVDVNISSIGAPNHDAVYTLKYQSPDWIESNKITGSDTIADDKFGCSIAIDKDVMVVGAYGQDPTGKAYVFRFDPSEDVWVEEAILTPSDGKGGWFGYSVSIEGDYIAIGAPLNGETIINGTGAVYIFQKSGGWTELVKLSEPNAEPSHLFGWSVHLNDGKLAVGATGITGSQTNEWGKAYLYDNVGNLIDSVPNPNYQNFLSFGYVVRITDDGNYLVVSATDYPDQGAVYIYKITSGLEQTPLQTITPTDASDADYFGKSLETVGDYIIVGAPNDDNSDIINTGCAYVYKRLIYKEAWGKEKKLKPFDIKINNYFGISVSILLSESAKQVIVGCYSDDNEKGTNAGAVYTYDITEPAETTYLTPPIQPVLQEAYTQYNLLTLVYSTALNVSFVPSPSDFEITGITGNPTIDSVAVATNRVILTLSGSAEADDVITIDYTRGGAVITSVSGGTASSFVDQVVLTLPSLQSAAIVTNDLTLQFDHVLDTNSVPSPSDFVLNGITGNPTIDNVSFDNDKLILTLSNDIAPDDIASVQYSKGDDPIKSIYGGEVLNFQETIGIIPVLIDSYIINDEIVLTFNTYLDDNLVPNIGHFIVIDALSDQLFPDQDVIEVNINNDVLKLRLTTPPNEYDKIGVIYTSELIVLTSVTGGEITEFTAKGESDDGIPVIPDLQSAVMELVHVPINDTYSNRITLQYSLPLTTPLPETSDFTLYGITGNPFIIGVGANQAEGRIVLTVSSEVESDDIITLDYIKGNDPIKTPSGGEAFSFTGQFVENKPFLSEVRMESNIITLQTNHDLDTNSTPSPSDFVITGLTGNPTIDSVNVVGDTVLLEMSDIGGESDIPTISYIAGVNPILNLSGGQLSNFSDESVLIIPVLQSASVDGNVVTLTYDRELLTGQYIGNSNNDFFVVGKIIEQVGSVSYNNNEINISLSIALDPDDILTMSYTQGTYNITSLSGGKADEFISFVTNVNVPSPVSPELYNTFTSDNIINLIYDQPLDVDSLPSTSDFVVYGITGNPTIDDVSFDNNIVILTLSGVPQQGDFITLDYTVGTNPIRNYNGDNATPLSGQIIKIEWYEVQDFALEQIVSGYGKYGGGVAVDGDVAVVSSWGGRCDIYERVLGVWGLKQTLTEDSGVYTPTSVAIYKNRIVVGRPLSEEVTVYSYNTTSLATEEQTLTASDGVSGDNFGYSTDIKDGIITVGSFYDDNEKGTDAGAVYVFTHNGSTWVEEQKLIASDGAASDRFGFSNCVDNGVIVIGAYGKDGSLSDEGAAYIFRHNGSTWVEEQKLTIDNGGWADNRFGHAVSVYNDVVVIGGYAYDNFNRGIVNVYRYTNNDPQNPWEFEQTLEPFGTANKNYFGFSLDVVRNTIVVGHREADDPDKAGVVHIYSYENGSWVGNQTLRMSDESSNSRAGSAVALDGDTILVGAPYKETAEIDGKIYFFKGPGSVNPLEFVNASVIFNTLTLTYDQLLNTDSVPSTSDFTVYGITGSPTITDVSISDSSVILTLSGDVVSGDTVTIDYTAGVNPISNFSNSEAQNLSGHPVTNLLNINFVEKEKLTASDGEQTDYFGNSVSISGDVALIGAPFDGDNGSSSGSAYIFRYNGANWVEEQKLTAPDGAASDYFGSSVSISGDVALVGAYGADVDSEWSAGAAYIFRYTNNDPQNPWEFEQKLTASDGEVTDYFGNSVSISGDVALVGAYFNDDNGLDAGAAYIYRYDGTGAWVEEDKLTASDGDAGDWFGSSVAISGDTAIVGAQHDGSQSGSAYIFRYTNNDPQNPWAEEQKLTASDEDAGDWFGSSVSISGDVALVGAHADEDNGGYSGSAYIFRYTNDDPQNPWIEEQKLTASDGAANDYFGSSVSLSGDVVLVGAYGADSDVPWDAGAAYIFRYTNNDPQNPWEFEQKLTASDGEVNDQFGNSLSLSGNVAIVGVKYDDDNGFNAGAAYIFENIND